MDINYSRFSVKEMGRRLKIARKLKCHDGTFDKSFTTKGVSNTLGITESRYKAWECGRNPIPLEYIPKLCQLLDFEVGYLFCEFDTQTRESTDIIKATGLSESAIKTMRNSLEKIENVSLLNDICCDIPPMDVVSMIFEQNDFWHIILSLAASSVVFGEGFDVPTKLIPISGKSGYAIHKESIDTLRFAFLQQELSSLIFNIYANKISKAKRKTII